MKGPVYIQRLPLGIVVHDTTGHAWVYVGFKNTKAQNVEHVFHASLPAPKHVGLHPLFAGVHRSTLVSKFPDLPEHWPE